MKYIKFFIVCLLMAFGIQLAKANPAGTAIKSTFLQIRRPPPPPPPFGRSHRRYRHRRHHRHVSINLHLPPPPPPPPRP